MYRNNENIEFEELISKFPWMGDFYNTSKELDTLSTIFPYYEHIDTMYGNRDFENINLFLKFINPHNLSDVLLIGILRLTSSWASMLSEWNNLLEKVRIEISVRGKSEQLLRGLIPTAKEYDV